MKVTRTDHTPTKVSLLIAADQYDLTPVKDHVLTHFAEKVHVPGFREGTAPPALVERHVDQNTLANEFIEHALNALYGRAVDQEKLRPAGQPEVKLKKFVPFTNLEFEAELEIIGPIKLPDYKKIKLAKSSVDVAIKEVDDVLNNLADRAAERKRVERVAKTGDELIVDFSGKDEKGAPIANTDAKDAPVLLGSGTFIPGFEDNLVGLKAGDKKSFNVTFPADYGVVAMQGKKVTFDTEVKSVNEISRPKLDDDFAKKVSPFKTLAELKADIKKQLKAEKQVQADRQYENDLILKISERVQVEVPKKLVDEQIQMAEEREKRDLAARGQTWREHLKDEGITEEQHRERQRPDIEKRVKAGLVLSEIAEKEAIQVPPDELETRLNLLKARYEDAQMQDELDKLENQREIASQIATEKTVAKLVEYASK